MGLLACSLVSPGLAGSSLPEHTLRTTIEDDTVLLHGTDASVRSAMGQIASLGFTYLRLTAGWSAISPHSSSPRIPKAPLHPANQATYPVSGLHQLDRAVLDAQQAGLNAMIDVAFWAPR